MISRKLKLHGGWWEVNTPSLPSPQGVFPLLGLLKNYPKMEKQLLVLFFMVHEKKDYQPSHTLEVYILVLNRLQRKGCIIRLLSGKVVCRVRKRFLQ